MCQKRKLRLKEVRSAAQGTERAHVTHQSQDPGT